ncbi:hypothetical protein AMC75_06955 [Staphylococcus carnosus]|uniref:ABC-2 transporter permease n=1 Tax=Staphylococcus carnosus TaxID=1281 RepID=UPI0006ABAC0B|nr:ABC-2 transporter permease [Staphylococcus carnosus]KOR12994.1 hypothetical protein AMC75_06955 [Staphylococcus carnosus]
MKGLIIGQYYATAKALITYLIISILLAIGVSYFGGSGSDFMCLLIVMLMVSAATDNLKNEAEAQWYKFAVTLPVSRKQIVQSHFLYYLITMMIGVGIVIIALIAGIMFGTIAVVNAVTTLGICLSIGLWVLLMYPFTYSVGADKSNMIQVIVTIIALGFFFVFNFISLIIGGSIYESGGEAMQHLEFELIRQSIFIVISLIAAAAGYFIGLNKFKKTNF